MRRKGLCLLLLAFLPWLALAVLYRLELTLWGTVAALALVLAMFPLLPRGGRWPLLQIFSLLFFAVACAAVLVMGKDLETRIPNLLAGGFATLAIMAGYGAVEGISFPFQYLAADYPESMRESPTLRRAFRVVTLFWDLLFVAGLAACLVSMLALRGDTSREAAALSSLSLLALGIIATPLIVLILPRRMEASLLTKRALSARWEPPLLSPGRTLARNEYDAVVVGAGMGGLACAAILSQAGLKTLVVEQATQVGGYARTYDWQGFPLNSGPTLLTGAVEGGALNALLRRLGLEETVKMRRMEWGLVGGKIALRLGQGQEADMAKLGNKFPASREGLGRLFADLRRFRGEWKDRADFLSSPFPADLDDYHEQFVRHPVSAAWQNLTFQEMLERYLHDEELVLMLGRLSSILGGEPASFPAYEGARLLLSLFIDGIHYPEGHLSLLTGRMATLVRETGGEVMTSCRAEEILVRGEGTGAEPIGLRLVDGTQVRCNVIVLDADPRRAASGLIPPSCLGHDFLREVGRLQPSGSAFALHLVFDEELRIPERVILLPAKPRRVRTGNTFLEVASIILSKEKPLDPSREGCVLMLRVNVPHRCLHAFEGEAQANELGAELATLVKEEVSLMLPAVKKAVREFVTLPSHFARLTGNENGSAFGFAPLASQWYYHLPGPRLPLCNLYLVGAWSRFGGGVEGAVLSGALVARELCGEKPYGMVSFRQPERGGRVRRGEEKEPSPRVRPRKRERSRVKGGTADGE
ncbi:MAG: NAD(P)/FAD-dependent oxidoreductase [Actinobacteria bacterium]|nr:NAD(P)/FAD-dependent oxidoreductase [Actinomycetota bacterium]